MHRRANGVLLACMLACGGSAFVWTHGPALCGRMVPRVHRCLLACLAHVLVCFLAPSLPPGLLPSLPALLSCSLVDANLPACLLAWLVCLARPLDVMRFDLRACLALPCLVDATLSACWPALLALPACLPCLPCFLPSSLAWEEHPGVSGRDARAGTNCAAPSPRLAVTPPGPGCNASRAWLQHLQGLAVTPPGPGCNTSRAWL
eukprot:366573-Chlamydomonas_euryale.AAC.12